MSNRNLALRLADHGIAIFPCRPDNKVPLCDWDDLSTTNPLIIHQWWTQHPHALPAIDLRKIGLIALDGDRHNPEIDGVAALRDLIKTRGIDMRGVPIAATPGNGIHCYFANPQKLGCASGSMPDGIDVKGDGGYTIAPGAVLPDQRHYRPIGACLLSAVKARRVPPLPAAIAEIIRTPKESKHERKHEGPPASNDRRGQAYARVALDGCVTSLAAMPKDSGRNIALNGGAYRLGRMVAVGWLNRGHVENALVEAMRANGYVGEEGIKAAQLTIASGIKAGLSHPHSALS